jgi:acetyl/propionyl-CoA carboxylase alpha subunit
MFDSVLVANRGEIARRVLRTLHGLGIRSLAIYTEADRDACHVREADDAELVSSYLAIDEIMVVAARCDAVHPGYGFLSENPRFARACEEMGVVFIGPSADAIELMGDKVRAKEVAAAAGVPRTACATTLDDFVKEFTAAQQAKALTTLVAKVDAVGPSAFVTDLGLLENRFQFQRYLQTR